MTPADMADVHARAFTLARPWSEAEFAELLDHPNTHLTASEPGFALWRAVAGEAELLTIAVQPEAQGQGVGRSLMRLWMAEAADDCTTAFLEVAADNGAACALYAKVGFDVVARRTGYYTRPTTRVDALVMRAKLGP